MFPNISISNLILFYGILKLYNLQQDPLWPTSQNIGNKSKNKQMGPNETYKLLHNKGNYKQGEKTALRLGENNSKWSNRQRINLQNIQATPPAQL